jgi:hypothetical protein
MRKFNLLASAAVGIVAGAVLFNTAPALADMPVIDMTSIAKEIGMTDILSTISDTMTTVSNTINDVKTYANGILGSLGDNTFGTVQQLLQEGFTQEANYAKAVVGAQEQIQDASNTANARFARDMRNAQIRDEQTTSPTACTALDGGVSTQSAAVQAYSVAATLALIHDQRGQASVGMPSHFGQAQGVASMAAQHVGRYCNADDAAANLCTLSTIPDADQEALSLFGSGTYSTQDAVATAKDYAINLIQPVAAAAIRGDQLTSAAGQDAAVHRRSYNARMSLAQTFVDNAIGMQTPSVPLTALQQQYLTNLGLPAQTTGSWLQVMQIEAERRVSDVTWAGTLQSMPPASVEREVAIELALTNYLMFQTFKMNLQHTTISAAHLAEDTERGFMPTVRMPAPGY